MPATVAALVGQSSRLLRDAYMLAGCPSRHLGFGLGCITLPVRVGHYDVFPFAVS